MISIGREKGETLDRKKVQKLAKEAREASEESNKRLVRGAKIKNKRGRRCGCRNCGLIGRYMS